MASTNRSSSSCSGTEKHEVFISFRGQDTRKGFTGYLNAAIKTHGIRTYVDDHNIVRGDKIATSLLRAIKDAQISVIVFSKNYSFSTWCFDELLKILECKRRGQMILPVFYDVNPSFVRNQIASYADSIKKYDLSRVQKWRDALTEATSYSGWDCTTNRKESELVEEIAKDELEKLNRVNGSKRKRSANP